MKENTVRILLGIQNLGYPVCISSRAGISELLYLIFDDHVGKEAIIECRPGGIGCPVLFASPMLAMGGYADWQGR